MVVGARDTPAQRVYGHTQPKSRHRQRVNRGIISWLSLDSHLEEICNYFNNRTTSGVTEGINTRIKLIIRQSYGFKNFDLMKEKLLACLFK
jgi:transposase